MRYREVVASVMVVVLVACSGAPRVQRDPAAAYTQDTRWYDVDVVERGPTPVQPLPVDREEFQRAVQEMARGIRLKVPPAEEARRLLEAPLEGDWLAEVYRGEVFTLVPLDEKTSVTPGGRGSPPRVRGLLRVPRWGRLPGPAGGWAVPPSG